MPQDDPFDLQRFVKAQDPVFATVLEELRAGHKRSHWMWFIFPQLRDLGRSATAQFYGIASMDEVRAYLAHPILGPRLAQATEAALSVQGRTLHEIFGSPDDLKFRSSMTLFAQAAAEDGDLYRKALDRYCGGQPDEATLKLLG